MTVKALRESLGNKPYSMLITYYTDGKEHLLFVDHKTKLMEEVENALVLTNNYGNTVVKDSYNHFHKYYDVVIDIKRSK